MNIQVVSTIISAGSQILGELIRNRTPSTADEPEVDIEKLRASFDEEEEEGVITKKKKSYHSQPIQPQIEPDAIPLTVNIAPKQIVSPDKENKATAIATGCIACSIGHFGTCSGLLNEATRFARGPNGAKDPEVIDRVNMCLDELNSLEREDLRPEKVMLLTGWEKELADEVLKASRETRHKLEDVSNINTQGLETIAGGTQTIRQAVGRKWFQNKIANLSQEDQEKVKSRIMQKLGELKMQAANGNLPTLELLPETESGSEEMVEEEKAEVK